MSSSSDSTIVARFNQHKAAQRGRLGVSFQEHVRNQRREIAARALPLKLIYLDTNAWKCLADWRQGKTSLTAEMGAFCTSMERAVRTGQFAFPIGLPTFFELDSMTDPHTRRSLAQLVDELSQGICILPFMERIGFELRKIRTNQLSDPEGLEDFLCSPIEILGVSELPTFGLLRGREDNETFQKAAFDTMTELPFSEQLEMAGTSSLRKWDNTRGIAELNAGKAAHQADITNLTIAIGIELSGYMKRWFEAEGVDLPLPDIRRYAAIALLYWEETPSTRALPTLRVLSSLYGLMRFDENRQYKNGDIADFMVATTALPVANALFTDRKLANLLSDSRIKLGECSSCAVVSGFGSMAEYLEEQMRP